MSEKVLFSPNSNFTEINDSSQQQQVLERREHLKRLKRVKQCLKMEEGGWCVVFSLDSAFSNHGRLEGLSDTADALCDVLDVGQERILKPRKGSFLGK